MKKLVLWSFAALGILFGWSLLAGRAEADIMPRGSHHVKKEVTIINPQEYPEVMLFSYVTGPMLQKPEVKEIVPGEVLAKGYKFNRYRVFSVPRELFRQKGKDFFRFEEPLKVGKTYGGAVLLSDEIEPYGKVVENSDPLAEHYQEYQLLRNDQGIYRLELKKDVRMYDHRKYGEPVHPQGQTDVLPGMTERTGSTQ